MLYCKVAYFACRLEWKLNYGTVGMYVCNVMTDIHIADSASIGCGCQSCCSWSAEQQQEMRGSLLFFVHEEYLGAVDMTSHVGTIPTGLASYFLV